MAFDNDGKYTENMAVKTNELATLVVLKSVDNLIRVINEHAVSNFCSDYES